MLNNDKIGIIVKIEFGIMRIAMIIILKKLKLIPPVNVITLATWKTSNITIDEISKWKKDLIETEKKWNKTF